MPWMRIDENALDHPKFVALSANAWRLWCEGTAYCQKHLTDGLIGAAVLRKFRYYSAASLRQLVTSLVPGKDACWHEDVNGNICVHDYLDFNDSRSEVLKARTDAKNRRRRFDQKHTDGTVNGTRSVAECENAFGTPNGSRSVYVTE